MRVLKGLFVVLLVLLAVVLLAAAGLWWWAGTEGCGRRGRVARCTDCRCC